MYSARYSVQRLAGWTCSTGFIADRPSLHCSRMRNLDVPPDGLTGRSTCSDLLRLSDGWQGPDGLINHTGDSDGRGAP